MLNSVLVTGGGTGIGAALALELAQRGCRVVISGRRAGRLDAIAALAPGIESCPGDVTDGSHRAELVTALAHLPAPRGVFHGAGSFQTGLLDGLSIGDWRHSFETNVEARWELSRRCAHVLQGGRVLFIGSDAASNPRVGAAAYSIAQAASEALRRSLRAEWADRDIAVGAFKPGLVDTDMVRGFMQLSPEEFPARSAYEAYMASGQLRSPTTVGRFAAWLLLDVPADAFAETEWDVRDATQGPGPASDARSELDL